MIAPATENSPFTERPVASDWRELQKNLDIHPVLARVLSARGISSPDEVNLDLSNLLPPAGLPGIQEAAKRLIRAIQDDELILIAGDYDVDGATSSALCVSMLQSFGAKRVDFVVPDRFRFGYGFSTQFVKSLLVRNPNVVVTVDNGISSVEGIKLAREHGIDVIVTDHHLPPEELPPAYAIVNPQLTTSTFASAPAGVGVAFYVMTEIRRQLRAVDYFKEQNIAEPKIADWLDLVALGTVVDLAPLDRNNRVLVANGLRRMRARKNDRPGIIALCEKSKVNLRNIDEEDLAFRLGPRLNAAGRLEDISIGIKLLLTDDLQNARRLAERLQDINKERREIQLDMTEDAFAHVRKLKQHDQKGVCLYRKEYHQGVVGLVAARIAERVNRPAVVFSSGSDAEKEIIKGSARSISGVHIRDVLAAIDSENPHLMKSFGGHAMAAGVTIHEANFERFSALFEKTLNTLIPEEAFERVHTTDGELKETDMSTELAWEIANYGPWGQEFEHPVFHGQFRVISERPVGGNKHLKLVLRKDKAAIDAIAFNQEPIQANTVNASYQLTINDRGGMQTLQLRIQKITAA